MYTTPHPIRLHSSTVLKAPCQHSFLKNFLINFAVYPDKEGKQIEAVLVTVREVPQGYETSRHPHILDSRLTDDGVILSLMQWMSSIPERLMILISVRGYSASGWIRSIEKSNDVIENRTRDLPACTTVPQPSTLPRVPTLMENETIKYMCKKDIKEFRAVQFGGSLQTRVHCLLQWYRTRPARCEKQPINLMSFGTTSVYITQDYKAEIQTARRYITVGNTIHSDPC
jgi:hypothetical protein